MAGWRDAAAAVLLFLSLVCVPPASPTPALLPHQARNSLTTTSAPSGWSLKDTLARVDDQLQRHNDYNDVMLESGEEDDQLSRLLYRLQHADRVREGWYDPEPTLPPLPDQRLDAVTSHQTHKGRREKRGRGGRRGKKKHRGKSWERRHGCVPWNEETGPSHRPGKHHSRNKHTHRSREKHRHRSRERCPPDGDISTTTIATLSTQIPTKPSPAPLTPGTPAESPEEGGGVGGGGVLDASVNYEDFEPDAEIFMPFL